MRLELADFPVHQATFDKKTTYTKGILSIDKQEILQIILEDPRITEADLEMVAPQEEARITYVGDVLEPRLKVQGAGCVFPGIMGGVDTVGSGTTHRLKGFSVIPSAPVPSTTRTGTEAPRPITLDMGGPGAAPGISDGFALVLVLKLQPGHTDLDYHNTLQMAEMRVGKRLAETTVGQKPESADTYELKPVDSSLPRVLFIQGLLTSADSPHPGNCYYGWPVREMLALWAHPNELFDGALTARCGTASGHRPTTWQWLNHPIVTRLYQEHGKGINFLGVLLQRIRFTTHVRKELTANQTAHTALSYGAQGVIITWEVAGNAFLDTMLTTAACEKLGIKAVLITYEGGGQAGEDPPLLYAVPEAVAIVSTGNVDRACELPTVKRVVGKLETPLTNAPGAPLFPANGPLRFVTGYEAYIGATDIWGNGYTTCREL